MVLGKNLFGNKKVLVTGASGLVGSHVCLQLLQQNVSVLAFVRNEQSKQKAIEILSLYKIDKNKLDYISWIYGDITNYDEVEIAVSQANIIFNCAGHVSFSNNEFEKLYSINVQGCANLVNACIEHSIEKLCHISSVAALGKSKDNSEITEEDEYAVSAKNSSYGYSKYLGEMEIWRGIAEGLNAVIVNPSVIIGPGQWNQSSGKFFSTIAKGLNYYTTGITGYVGVWDVAKCMILITNSGISAEKFILNSENVDYKRFFKLIAENIGAKVPKKQATPALMKTAAIFLAIRKVFTGKPSQINFKTVKTSFAQNYFSNAKICNTLDFNFEKIEDVIKKTAIHFPKK